MPRIAANGVHACIHGARLAWLTERVSEWVREMRERERESNNSSKSHLDRHALFIAYFVPMHITRTSFFFDLFGTGCWRYRPTRRLYYVCAPITFRPRNTVHKEFAATLTCTWTMAHMPACRILVHEIFTINVYSTLWTYVCVWVVSVDGGKKLLLIASKHAFFVHLINVGCECCSRHGIARHSAEAV